MKRSPSSYTTTPKSKKGQNSTKKQKSVSAYCSVVYTAVVKVDIKVINASLTQNQCLQCVTPPFTHVEICDRATPLN